MACIEKVNDLFNNWKFYIAFYILFSLALLAIQNYVLTHLELFQVLILYPKNVTLVNLFGSNFVNRTVDSAAFNLAMMWLGLLSVFIFSKNAKGFSIVSCFLLLIFPFIVSGFNIVISPMIQSEGFIGFSGVSSAFFGVGVYYFVKWCHNVFQMPPEGRHQMFVQEHLLAISVSIALIPVPIFLLLPNENIFSYIQEFGLIDGVYYAILTEKVNVFAHAFSYVFGLLFAHVIDRPVN